MALVLRGDGVSVGADDDDPLGRLKVAVGYLVIVTWTVLFVSALVRPPGDLALHQLATTVALVVAGSLYADRFIRRNGNGGRRGR